MEETNIQPGRRRLVLGFDAGCMTCSDLARRIEEKVHDKLDIRSLRDPQVEQWRKQALGEDAPWAPTLVEVDGGKVRAWTGIRLGVRLSRALGPVATWKVMQALGEANGELELADNLAARAARAGSTRGQFLKGVGGAAVAMTVLSSTSSRALAAEDTDIVWQEELVGESLVDVARNMATRKDVVNMMGEAWANKVRGGRSIRTEIKGESIESIDVGGGGRVSTRDGKVKFSGDVVAIKAVKRKLKDGNSMMAVSYVMPKSDRFLAYYEYEKPVFLPRDQVRTKTEALLYKPDGEGFVVEKASSNKRSQILPQEIASRASGCGNDRRCNGPCDVVRGYSRCRYIKSTGCIAFQCRACAITCLGGVLLCGACAVIVCAPGVIRECCRGGYGCKVCGFCQ